ncbi:hypothetical protein HN587_00965 [Candidatus Woesearchaeota archaeon]|jgi:hypothetical protein|nr:hypothetical protein [Candidatus Woesearchaeota archaeon]
MTVRKKHVFLKKGISSKKKTFLLTTFVIALFALSLIVYGALQDPQTFLNQEDAEHYTKYFFSRDECRYLFPEGSCIVDDQYCNQNSYDYSIMKLEPYSDYCEQGTVVFNAPTVVPSVVPKPTSTESKDSVGDCTFVQDEGSLVSLRPEGYDPDKDIGPAGKLLWTFFEPFNNQGAWQTVKGDAGIIWSKVKLSDGEFYDERTFCIELLKTNSPPKLVGAEDVFAKEGETVNLDVSCSDPDGDKLKLYISGFMTSAQKELSFEDAGTHAIKFVCQDPDGETDEKTITLTVEDVNRPPQLVTPDTVVVDEKQKAVITAKVADPDGDSVTVTFESPFDEKGEWVTVKGDFGTKTITVEASDGKAKVSKDVKVVVNKINSAPVLSDIKDIIVYEGEVVEITPKASDEDGDKLSVSFEGFMSAATKQTDYDGAGEYTVTVTVKDLSGEEDSQVVNVKVINRNRPPSITKLK